MLVAVRILVLFCLALLAVAGHGGGDRQGEHHI